MKYLHPLAEKLNNDIKSANNSAFELLSDKGKKIYFPYTGILGQTNEAKNTTINATIGTAFEEDSSPLCLECMESLVNIPSEAFLYASSFGNQNLRELWKKNLYKKNPSLQTNNISTPVVTNALTHGIYLAAYLFVNENDSVILPDLCWDNYELIFSQNFNATLTYYRTFDESFNYNVEELQQKLLDSSSTKKILVLNFPNNPTGYSPTVEEAYKIKKALLTAAESGKKIVALIDDAYFGLVYEDGIFNESIFTLLADLHPNILAIKLDAPTKEDYVWGFRIGFITFSIANATPSQLSALEAKTAGALRASISSCSNPAQNILFTAYQHPNYDLEKKQKFQILKNRYLKIKEILLRHPEFKSSFIPMPHNSGYFMCIKPLNVDNEELRKLLISQYNTGVISISGLIRIAFSAVPLDKLEQLFLNIHSAITYLQQKAK